MDSSIKVAEKRNEFIDQWDKGMQDLAKIIKDTFGKRGKSTGGADHSVPCRLTRADTEKLSEIAELLEKIKSDRYAS